MRKVVFDIETTNIFSEVGKNDPALLNLAVVGIHDSETNEYSTYEQEELKTLWPILEKTDVLIGFNSDHFDIPLLNKYYPGDLTKIKSLDLMKEIKDVLGRRIGLGAIAEATLGTSKSGHGLEAITWWKNGEKEKVKKYCLDDVRLTRELYEYGIQKGYFKYKEGPQIKEIKLNTKHWNDKQDSGMTHTLPF